MNSEVCPMYFRLGRVGTLEHSLTAAGFAQIVHRTMTTTLEYADADEACRATAVQRRIAPTRSCEHRSPRVVASMLTPSGTPFAWDCRKVDCDGKAPGARCFSTAV